MRLAAFVVALIFMCQNALATDVTTLNQVSTMTVTHPSFKTPMTFNVTLPSNYQSKPDKRYFVLFDLHPRSQPYLSGMHDWLSHNGEWPWLDTLVVTPANYHPEFAALFEHTVESPDDPKLLDFIEHTVLGKVAKDYRTNGFNMFSGFMSNGAIGLYSLLNRPHLFKAYFISSPTLNNDFLGVSKRASSALAKLDDNQRFLYLSIGGHNYEKAHRASTQDFATALKAHAPKSLTYHNELNAPHNYMMRPVMTVLGGIERLFDDYHTPLAADSDISRQGVAAILAHYRTLSQKKYGFEISAERSIRNLAKAQLESAPDKAIAIYQEATTLYPDSAYAFADLASAYAQKGELTKAITLQKQAVAKSHTMVAWHQRRIKAQLKKLEEQE